jgi:hypothetical protein
MQIFVRKSEGEGPPGGPRDKYYNTTQANNVCNWLRVFSSDGLL